MKIIHALVIGTSILAMSAGVASAQNAAKGGGDPEAHQNGQRIVGPGDPQTRSNWRGREGRADRWQGREGRADRWQGRESRRYGRWDNRGYGRYGYGYRDRGWYGPSYGAGYGFGLWPFSGFTAFDSSYDDPLWAGPVPTRRVVVERRGRYGAMTGPRPNVANPSRGAQSGN